MVQIVIHGCRREDVVCNQENVRVTVFYKCNTFKRGEIEKLDSFNIEQVITHGCNLSPHIYLFFFIYFFD